MSGLSLILQWMTWRETRAARQAGPRAAASQRRPPVPVAVALGSPGASTRRSVPPTGARRPTAPWAIDYPGGWSVPWILGHAAFLVGLWTLDARGFLTAAVCYVVGVLVLSPRTRQLVHDGFSLALALGVLFALGNCFLRVYGR